MLSKNGMLETYPRFEFENRIMEMQNEDEKIALDAQTSNNMISALHQILKPFMLRRIKTDGKFFF